VFLDLPLEAIHKSAFAAAKAARCAGEQGKYWEMHDRLFASQKELEPWTPHAQAIGLDTAAFDACVASDRLDAAIRRDIAEAQKLGITGTPAFLIGRTDPKSSKLTVAAAVRGARPFADFEAEIDKVLAEAEKPAAVEAPPGR
jgi:protein-disulfide isomerase